MINLNKLIEFLPWYFKDRDSYKDQQGKGLIERFLELVGEYMLDDSNRPISLMPNIVNILDIIDIDYTRAIYLDYIYEFLGFPPQNYITPVSETEYLDQPPYYVWYLNYNTPLLASTRIGHTPEVTVIPRKHYDSVDRNIIKYAISLYKIRGTVLFYEVLLRSYFSLLDFEYSGENIPIQAVDDSVRYDNDIWYDSSYQYDGLGLNCNSCSRFIIDLTPYSDRVYIDEQARLRSWLEKYSPINVELQVAFQKADITIQLMGPEVPIISSYDPLVSYSGSGEVTVGYNTTIKAKVLIPYEFVGWYNDDGTIISTDVSYTFMVTSSSIFYLKYIRLQ